LTITTLNGCAVESPLPQVPTVRYVSSWSGWLHTHSWTVTDQCRFST